MDYKNQKIMGLDYGDFSIGIALYDIDTDFLYPYKTLWRKKSNVLRQNLREIIEIMDIENVSMIVVGLPLTISADTSRYEKNERTAKVECFVEVLSKKVLNGDFNHNKFLLDITKQYNNKKNIILKNQIINNVNINNLYDEKSQYKCSSELEYLENETLENIIFYQNEYLTTKSASEFLSMRGIKKENQKRVIDNIAAKILLSDFVDEKYKKNGTTKK